MERDGWIGRERERERGRKRERREREREEWQGVGPSKKCKKKESFDEDGRAFRRKETDGREKGIFPFPTESE